MRSKRSGYIVVLSIQCIAVLGCATPFGKAPEGSLDEPPAVASASAVPPGPTNATSTSPPPNKAPAATPNNLSAGSPPVEQLVRSLPGLEPQAQAQLLADLKQTDPAHWPKLMQAFQVASGNRATSTQVAEPSPLSPGVPGLTGNAAPSGLRPHPYHPAAVAHVPVQGETPAVVQAEQAGGLAQAFRERRDPQAALASLNDPLDEAADAARQVSFEAPASSDSSGADEALAEAIRALEGAGEVGAPGSAESARQAIQLRLLCLAAGRRDDALRPIPGVTSAEQEYWSSQLFALSAWLDSEKIPAADRRANESLAHLDAARAKLAEIGGLQVRNPQFCTRVDGFGSFTKFKEYVFRPGQEVVLYVELENFRSESTSDGYRTALSSRYRILDSQSRQVTEHEFPPIEEVCQNRRRDYYVSFRVTMPERVYDGRHTLQLTIEDTLGKKVGQTTIEFAVKE